MQCKLTSKTIAFTGLDGCGKTTQVNLAERYLKSRNINAKKIRFIPNSYKYFIRKLAFYNWENEERRYSKKISATLLAAKLFEEVNKKIVLSNEPAVVLCDQYIYKHLALMAANGIESKYLREFLLALPVPDIILFFDLPPQICYQRIVRGRKLVGHGERANVLCAQYEQYRKMAGEYNMQIINADGSRDKIHQEVRHYLDAMIGASYVSSI